MKKIYLFFAALLCCSMSVQIKAQDAVVYDFEGIRYVLIELTYGSVTTRSAYVVHPQTVVEEDYVPTEPCSYTGAIVIPDTILYGGNGFPVKFINDSAFHQSTITSIDLPATVTVFNSGAFKDCQMLEMIICRADTPPSTRIHSQPWDYEDVFGSLDPEQVSVFVPEDYVIDYQEAGGWDAFTHYYAIGSPEGIESVSPNPSVQKVIMDGALYILREGHVYTITGGIKE